MRYLFFSLATLTLTLTATVATSRAKLSIISPHRKSLQEEYLRTFKEHHKLKYKEEVDVSWLDQGGASDDLRFILSRFEKNPASAGIDIFWGGGEHPFYELDRLKLLTPHQLPGDLRQEIPALVAGVKLYNQQETWHASAMSSFGIFYNKPLYRMLKLPEPATWEDLARPELFGNLSNADPRRSSSNVTMNLVILQALGWEKGWELLTLIAGNTGSYTHSSSDPIKAVVSGNAAAGLAIGYFADAKIGDIGAAKLGFALPASKTIINPDPIAILKGAPNAEIARRFIDFVLSVDGQKLLILPKGAPGGPVHSTLGRMAINARAYTVTQGLRSTELNPFALNFSPMMLDVDKATELQFIFTDMLGATHIDTHKELKAAWQAIIKRGCKPAEIALLAKPPVSQQEMVELAKKWNDNVVRNKTINQWVAFAKDKYAQLIKAGI